MKFYIAGSVLDASELSKIADKLEHNGHELTVKWWQHDVDKVVFARHWKERKLESMAVQDLFVGVRTADVVLAMFTHADSQYAYEGTRFEVAFALGSNIPVFAVVPELLALCEADAKAFEGKEYIGPAYGRSFGIATPGITLCKSLEEALRLCIKKVTK